MFVAAEREQTEKENGAKQKERERELWSEDYSFMCERVHNSITYSHSLTHRNI